MIRPMESRDKAAVTTLIEATGFFRPEEAAVAEELIDIYLGVPAQKDYRVIVIEGGRVAMDGNPDEALAWYRGHCG